MAYYDRFMSVVRGLKRLAEEAQQIGSVPDMSDERFAGNEAVDVMVYIRDIIAGLGLEDSGPKRWASGDGLRSKLIRLAHENPDLRTKLLPLVTGSQERTAGELSGRVTTVQVALLRLIGDIQGDISSGIYDPNLDEAFTLAQSVSRDVAVIRRLVR